MKKCKYCQSQIDKDAIICPFCRKRQKNTGIFLTILIISAVVGTIGLYFLSDYIFDSLSASTSEKLSKVKGF